MAIKIQKACMTYYITDTNNSYYKSWYEETKIDYEEEWKDVILPIKVDGFKISNYGRLLRPDGSIAPQYYDKDGYQRVSIFVKDFYGPKKHLRSVLKTHRLVALHFIPNDNPEIKTIVMHKNDIRDCNFYTNLKWGTHKENMDHKMLFGRHKALRGVEKTESKHSEELVHKVCELLQKGFRGKNVLKELGLLSGDNAKDKTYVILVANLKKRHIWSHITKNYVY